MKPINIKLATLLKEKGFSTPTNKYYQLSLTSRKDVQDGYSGPFGWKKGELSLLSGFFVNNHKDADGSNKYWFMCSAPTIGDVVEWLYENYKFWVSVDNLIDDRFYFSIRNCNTTNYAFRTGCAEDGYLTSIEAYEAAIKYSLENII